MDRFPDYNGFAKKFGLPRAGTTWVFEELDDMIRCYKLNTGAGAVMVKNICDPPCSVLVLDLCKSTFGQDAYNDKCGRFYRELKLITNNL
jgi:hypothetical protein